MISLSKNSFKEILGTQYYYTEGLDGLILNNDEIKDKIELNGQECISCGEFVENDLLFYSPNDEPYCEWCYNANFFICQNCGEVESVDCKYYIHNHGNFCYDCFNSSGFACQNCNENFHIEDGSFVENMIYCENCLSKIEIVQCIKCNETIRKNNAKYDDKYNAYCETCFENKKVEVA